MIGPSTSPVLAGENLFVSLHNLARTVCWRLRSCQLTAVPSHCRRRRTLRVIAPTFLVRPGAYTRTRQTRRRHWHMRLGLNLLGLAGLLVLLATGWHLPGISPASVQAASRLSHPVALLSTAPVSSTGGASAGGVPAVQVANPATPADFCLPTDAGCWMQSVASGSRSRSRI